MGKINVFEDEVILQRACEKVNQWSERLTVEIAEIFGEEVDVVSVLDVYAITMATVIGNLQTLTGSELTDLFIRRFRSALSVRETIKTPDDKVTK